MGNKKYQQYLLSPTWRKKRKELILSRGCKCELCESRKHLVVHHKEYPEVLGAETNDMLMCLCETCHNVHFHGGSLRGQGKHKRPKVKGIVKKVIAKFNKRKHKRFWQDRYITEDKEVSRKEIEQLTEQYLAAGGKIKGLK